MVARSMVSTAATASMAPAAASPWPVTPLVEVTSGPGSPKTLVMARASARSLSGVEVPCALMWPDVGRRDAGVGQRQLHAGDRTGAVGRGCGDVVGVGGAGRPGELGVDGGARGRRRGPSPRARVRPRPRS